MSRGRAPANNLKTFESDIIFHQEDLIKSCFVWACEREPVQPLSVDERIALLMTPKNKKKKKKEEKEPTISEDTKKIEPTIHESLPKEKDKTEPKVPKQSLQKLVEKKIEISLIDDDLLESDTIEEDGGGFDSFVEIEEQEKPTAHINLQKEIPPPVIPNKIEVAPPEHPKPTTTTYLVDDDETFNTSEYPREESPSLLSSDFESDMSDYIKQAQEEDEVGSATLMVVLRDIKQEARDLCDEISSKLKTNPKDPEIYSLKNRRRSLWDEIESLEAELQNAIMNEPVVIASNDVAPKKKNNVVMPPFLAGVSDDDDDDLDQEIYSIFPELPNQAGDPAILEKITDINQKIFHHMRFRGIQVQAIEAALKNEDVFVLMPTGGGKSLCYQLTGYLQGGLTVVISPLISLIQDQVRSLEELQIPACSLSGDTERNEYSRVLDMICRNRLRFLYITPEKLLSGPHLLNFLLETYKYKRITRFVIDEAHCVSQWGHDFRPSYTHLDIIKERFQGVPIMALTATATRGVKEDIKIQLKIQNCKTYQMSFNRKNLIYEVQQKDDNVIQTYHDMEQWIRDHHYEKSCGLIFCMATADTEKISAWLNEHGLRTAFYHAKMKKPERVQVQRDWTSNKINIIVATLAFGMGIDKPDVRFVIHHTLPKSLEAYYQESGRAGRDLKDSRCLLLFRMQDRGRVLALIKSSQNDRGGQKDNKRLSVEENLLNEMVQYAVEKIKCRRVILLRHFDEEFDERNCDKPCDNCSKRKENRNKITNVDVTEHAINLARLIERINKARKGSPYCTPVHLIEVYIGLAHRKITECGDDKLPEAGKGKDQFKGGKTQPLYQILNVLRERGVIKEKQKVTSHGAIKILKPGPGYYTVSTSAFENVIIQEIEEEPLPGLNKAESALVSVLNEVRSKLATDNHVKPNQIMTHEMIKSIAQIKPMNINDMLRVKGMTKNRAEQYGNYFATAVERFVSTNPMNSNVPLPYIPPPPIQRTQSKGIDNPPFPYPTLPNTHSSQNYYIPPSPDVVPQYYSYNQQQQDDDDEPVEISPAQIKEALKIQDDDKLQSFVGKLRNAIR